MRKLLFLLFPAFSVLSVLNCSSGDKDMPCVSCGDEPPIVTCPNAVTSSGTLSCGGQTYKTVNINGQIWMAENLNYDASGSVCYNNQTANCDKYGRLYNWSTAMGISSSYNSNSYNPSSGTKYKGVCPSGWHIPNNAEWDKLMRYVDGTSGTSSPYDSPFAGIYLKAREGWNSCGPSGSGKDDLCEDTHSFSALPGGYGYSGGYFSSAGDIGSWWSASEDDSDYAYNRCMSCYIGYLGYSHDKSYLFSVRCLQD